MTSSSHTEKAMTLRDYLHVALRQKWAILAAVVLVPAAAIAFSLQQPKEFQASAQVLVNTQSATSQLTGVETPTLPANAMAALAHTPAVARVAMPALAGEGFTVPELLADTSVTGDVTTNILSFVVSTGDAGAAEKAANAYVQAFTKYRSRADRAAIRQALKRVDRGLAALRRQGGADSVSYADLVTRQQALDTMLVFNPSDVSILQVATGAAQTQPKTSRNALLGLILGLVLGVGLAFLRESLDTRVRNAEEVAERLHGLPPHGIPLLARVPAPPKHLRDAQQIVMLEEPDGVHAETFRMLRANLDFVMLDRDIRMLMVTSAVQQEGKSTVAANLAVALARSGARVALVDLDLRRPILANLFGLEGPGLTEVALGRVSLDEALVSIALTDLERNASELKRSAVGNGNGHRLVKGILEVLPSGPTPPDPGEFVGTEALARVLAELRERADVVLIDTPPVLVVGDATVLSSRVDGILVATRLKVVRRSMLQELGRRLTSFPTPVLGFVATGASEDEDYYGYPYGYEPRARKPVEQRVPAESRRS